MSLIPHEVNRVACGVIEGCAEVLNVNGGRRSVRCLRTAVAAKVCDEARAAKDTLCFETSMPPYFIKVQAEAT